MPGGIVEFTPLAASIFYFDPEDVCATTDTTCFSREHSCLQSLGLNRLTLICRCDGDYVHSPDTF